MGERVSEREREKESDGEIGLSCYNNDENIDFLGISPCLSTKVIGWRLTGKTQWLLEYTEQRIAV